MTIAGQEQPPLRWIAGADAIATAEQKCQNPAGAVDAYRDLSSSLALDDA